MTFQPKPPTSATSTSGRTSRIVVRRKAVDSLSAVQLTESQIVGQADGTLAPVPAGTWVIYQGNRILAHLSPEHFAKTFEPVEEGLLLRPETRAKLETQLGLGATKTPEDLFRAIDRLARIRVGEITLNFTAGQLEELAQRAAKRRQTLPEYLARLLERFTEDLWKISAA